MLTDVVPKAMCLATAVFCFSRSRKLLELMLCYLNVDIIMSTLLVFGLNE